MKGKSRKSVVNWGMVGLTLLGIGLFNGVVRYASFRLDLTSDKRYTLHPATKAVIARLEAPVHVDVYLAGDLPMAFKQLQYNLEALLEELKAITPQPITYQLVDITQEPVDKQKEKVNMLLHWGIEPTNLYQQVQGKRIERLVYPGIVITYQTQSVGLILLKSNTMVSPAAMISQSIENLEYEVSNALAQLINPIHSRIGLVQGHDEPGPLQLSGLMQALQRIYAVDGVLLSREMPLTAYGALLITKPQTPFSEAEKYRLDQYIMQGGKVLFFLDRLRVDMDSLTQGHSFAFPLELNIDDQLFKYGVRINPDLIKDLQAGIYPIVVGKMGNQPQLKFLPWPFFPVLNNFADHVVTKNMNALYAQFVSSIDTVQVKDVSQTALVYSSPHSAKAHTPVYVDVSLLRKSPDLSKYSQGPIPIAYLVEGRFTSLYKNRFAPVGVDTTHFMECSTPTKIMVVSTGSLVLNAVSPREKKPLPWGYDPFLQQHFANQDFVLNVLDYMLADAGVINAKRKTVNLRPLDTVKVTQERLYWQLWSILTPLVLLCIGGIGWYMVRKRRYGV